MNTYKITGRTNGWIAQRDSLFKGKEYITIERGLTLKEAQKKILDFFNEDYETCYKNWGLVRCNSDMAFTHNDGTRGYEYDSRYFEIEEEDFYRVDDTESGNWVIYEGNSIQDAIDEILNDMESDEPVQWDLYKNGERIWCGKIDTIDELKELNK